MEEEQKVLNDDELEMLFQTNTTNFIGTQKNINKKQDDFNKHQVEINTLLKKQDVDLMSYISKSNKTHYIVEIILLLLVIWSNLI